jgi:hypothetical protein
MFIYFLIVSVNNMVFLKKRINRVSAIVLILILIASSAAIIFSNNGTNHSILNNNPSGSPISQYSAGQSIYNVSFVESGLLSGMGWKVNLSGNVERSFGTVISFSEPNGTYQYTITNISGYSSSQNVGTITVDGFNITQSIIFTSLYNKITFTESGLYSGASWGVILNGTTERSSSSTITFLLPNGVYNYKVLPVSGMNIVQSSGKVPVSGSDVDVAVQFTTSFYDVTFLATGLPSGLSWSVNLNSTVVSSDASTIVFLEHSGTYNYKVFNVSGFFAIPSTGNVVVNGNVEVEINFVKSYYSLTFSENSLPSGMTWSVYVHNSTLKIGQSSNSNAITFSLPNGSFEYSVVTENGYAAVPPSGTINVSGSNTAITIVFEQGYYTVQFNETGLEKGTPWQVILKSTATSSNKIIESSDNSSILFSIPDGEYTYSPENLSGYMVSDTGTTINVNNANEIVNLVYSSSYYKVTFTESGLPSGTEWNVVVSFLGKSLSLNESSYNNTITYYLANGNYTFKVVNESGFVNSPVGEKFVVQGAYIDQPVFFSSEYFPVYFNESGLLPSTQWAIKLNNTIERSQGRQVTFQMKEGIYNFSVMPVSGFVLDPSPPTTITVKGITYQSISFKNTTKLANLSSGNKYTVYFNETGLLAGSNWQVLVNQSKTQISNYSQGSGTVRFSLRNGTYYYKIISPASYYSVLNSSGYFNVSGTYQTINTEFLTSVNSVSFTETGLPPGTDWSVVASGTNISTKASSSGTGTVTLLLPNGTYFFEFLQVGNYTSNPHFEYVNINGTFNQPIVFTPSIYQAEFSEKGLPSGTDWSVVVNGVTYSSGGTGFVYLELQNGTYYYYIPSIAGYNDTNSSGVMTIFGNTHHIQTTFTNIAYILEFTETGLPPGSSWSVTVGSKVYTSDFSNMTIHLTNGTYHYYINLQYGYTATNASGFFNITGSNIPLRTTFKSDLSTIQFIETGLPSGTDWFVTINGTIYSSSNGIITDHLLNGTYEYFVAVPYGYTVTNSSGFVYIQGTQVYVNVTFMSDLHKIQFTETGLPSGTDWRVHINGSNYTSFGSNISVNLPNGTYLYVIISVNNYYVAAPVGMAYLDGGNLSIKAEFYNVQYNLEITESGLPSGLEWGMSYVYNQGENHLFTFSNTEDISVVNGTYLLWFTSSNSSKFIYYPEPLEVIVYISGNNDHIFIHYSDFVYNISLLQKGLPTNTNWSIDFNGLVLFSNYSNYINMTLQNGTYSFTVNDYNAYYPVNHNPNQVILVHGTNEVITVVYNISLYKVTFAENGLPSGSEWNLSLKGLYNSSRATYSTNDVNFELTNGTYLYTVESVNKTYIAPPSRTFTVSGSPLTIYLNFTEVTYNVTFKESGLPLKTTWSINLDGKIDTTNNTTFSLLLPNGTYDYSIGGVSGYHITSTLYGNFTVNGKSVTLDVTYAKNQTTTTPPPPPPPAPAKKPFTLPLYFYEVLIIVIIAGIGIAATIYTQQKKKINK